MANPLATGNLTVSTRFRAVVHQRGVRGGRTRADAAVSVDAMPVGGTAVADGLRGLLQHRHDDHAKRADGWDREVAVLDGQLGHDQRDCFGGQPAGDGESDGEHALSSGGDQRGVRGSGLE